MTSMPSLTRRERLPLSGWDFSFLAGRIASEALTWSYVDLATEASRAATRVLDIDTGGCCECRGSIGRVRLSAGLARLALGLGGGRQRGRQWSAAVEHTAAGPPGDQ